MKKDVIYIDTEDDITAIIDKVKHAKAPVVALVPPKRTGALQSTVNLKLLQRAAEASNRRAVLITNDPALTALASGLAFPIAKNLQSKPEIAELTSFEDDETDVIEGEAIASTSSPQKSLKEPVTDSTARDDMEEDITEAAPALAVAATPLSSADKEATPSRKASRGLGAKIPDFDTFRKKLFVFGGLGALLVAFLVWAIVFAPQASIAISARTNAVNINKTLQLKPEAKLDAAQGILPVMTKQVKKTVAVDFTPTGKKEVGDKATGTVKFTPTSANAILNGATIPAGTQLTSGALVFITNSAVTIPPTSFPDYLNNKTASITVSVTAAGPGAKYNGVSGALGGEPAGVSAAMTTASNGGSDKTVTVVSADDIAKAAGQLQSQDANAVKSELSKQFAEGEMVITEAYSVEAGNPVSTPAVDQEATAAKITAETTYTLLGIKRDDLKAVYTTFLAAELKGDNSQKVYKSGDEATQFSSFQKAEGGYSIRAIGVAQVGPNIDGAQIAESVRGKMKGEVQQSIGTIQGVQKVDVTFAPFWVSRVPNDASHVKVTFVVTND